MVATGGLPLVGREQELATLRAALAAAAEGTAAAVLMTGEAGVGKTRLLRAFREDVLSPGTLVLTAQCVDLGEPGLPFLTLTDVLRGVRERAASSPEVAAALDRAPALSDLARLPEHDGDGTRRLRVVDAAATLLGELGRSGAPVVVLVEDAQWVDDSSAALLRFLLGRMTTEHLLVVVTVRTDGLAARPRARRLVADLDRLPGVERLDLAPFDADEVATFLALAAGEAARGPAGDPGTAAEVLRRTGGNPYFVATLAAELSRTGGLAAGPPRLLSDLLVGRLDRLPAEARALVECVAIGTRPVSHRMLRHLAGLDDDTLDAALRLAVGDGLLVADGAGFALPHDLLRSAVDSDLLPGRRARLHTARATALEAGVDGAPAPAEVAHHHGEAGNALELFRWSVVAAEEAMRVPAPAEALDHLERADATRSGLPGPTDPSPAALAVRAARAAGLAGEPRRAVDWARRGVARADEEGDVEQRARARGELARRLVEADDPEAAVAPAGEAVRLCEASGTDPGLEAASLAVLGRSLTAARRPAEARPVVDRALLAARAAGLPGLEAEVLSTAALLDEVGGDLGSAAARLRDALRLARTAGEQGAELRAHYSLASLHYYTGDVAGSLPVLRTAMARVTESGLRWSEAGVELRILDAVARYVSGDLEGSLRAARSPETPPPDVPAVRLAAVGCYAAVAAGLPDAADRLAALRVRWSTDPQVALVAGGCDAERLTWEGDTAGAVGTAGRALEHLDGVLGDGFYGGLWLSALALAALADAAAGARGRRDAGAVADAVRHGEPLMGRAERLLAGGHGRPGDLGPEGRAWYARARAEYARLREEPDVAAWREALAAFGYGHAYEQARCRWHLAVALVRAGDRDAARTELGAAADAATAMGAVPLARAIAATATRERLGAAATGRTVLTGREHEVLALVAEGLTNREIGRRLYISEKTASVHLSNLMAKLDVASRTEAVTVARRRGLLDVG